jgi:hypothetical protein
MRHIATLLLFIPSLALAGADGDVESDEGVRVSAHILGWATLYDMDRDPQADPATYGDPEADPGVSLRRATLGFEGRRGRIEWDLELGHSQRFDALSARTPLFSLFDAYAGYALPAGPGNLRLVAGQFRPVFSGEVLSSSAELLFQERSPGAEWLGGSRELGLLADYRFDFGLRARMAVQNGGGDLDGDDNLGKRLSARVEFQRGDSPYATGRVGAGNLVNVGAGVMRNDDVATATTSVSGDVRLRFGGLSINGEFIRSDIRPANTDVAEPTVQAGTVRLGANTQVSYLVPMKHGGLEFGARAAYFDDAQGKTDNGDLGVLHVGLSRRDALPGLDFGVGYVHRQEFGGTSMPNDTVRAWFQWFDKVRLDHQPEVPVASR